MKKLFITCFLSIPVLLMAQIDSTNVILQEGTIIKAALMNDISGKEVSVGQTIDFELSENVILNDYEKDAVFTAYVDKEIKL